jgi:hypothetical protein
MLANFVRLASKWYGRRAAASARFTYSPDGAARRPYHARLTSDRSAADIRSS